MTSEAAALKARIEAILPSSHPPVDEQTPLVSSGLIDSMALVDLLLALEDITCRRIPAARVQPKDMNTIALMLATAERVGRPRK